MTETTTDGVRWIVDGYQEWVEREGVPIYSGLAFDTLELETRPWARMGVDGAFVHVDARGDYCSMYLLDIAAGGATTPQRHLFEEVYYVLDGRGSTTVEFVDGGRRSFEWGKGSLFALPVNLRYQHFNTSGRARARLSSVSNLPMVMKLFRNEAFIFNTPFDFKERLGDDRYFGGKGTFIPVREHRHQWETIFIPDLLGFDQLTESPGRGRGSTNIQFVLADGTLHAHMSEIPPGNYKKAHRHGEGYHIFQLSGGGYSLYWHEGQEPMRVDWSHGLLHSPPLGMWHQHFNVTDEPARYMAIAFGSIRYPFTKEKVDVLHRTYTVKSDFQIDYEDEAPWIRKVFEEERARHLASVGRVPAQA